MESDESEMIREFEENIIIIDVEPIGTLNFNLSILQKNFLLECGRLSALKFIIKKGLVELDQTDFNLRTKKLDELRTKLLRKRKKNHAYIKVLIALIFSCITFYFFIF